MGHLCHGTRDGPYLLPEYNLSADSSITDEALMIAFQHQGQSTAFNTLYQRYHNQLYRYLFNRLNDRNQTDELFQDIWARVIKTRYKVQAKASFRTWFYTIARNRLIDEYRKSAFNVVNVVNPEHYQDELVDAESPEKQLSRDQDNHAILNNLKRLPREQQDVFLLKAESGLSLQEIADITGENFETTKSRYRYAIQKLAQLLDESHEPG